MKDLVRKVGLSLDATLKRVRIISVWKSLKTTGVALSHRPNVIDLMKTEFRDL